MAKYYKVVGKGKTRSIRRRRSQKGLRYNGKRIFRKIRL